MNRSEISNDFNFENQLDISNTRKDRTENYFTKEGFQFEDFMNIGDRTAKSDKFESKINVNTSVISKKEGDQPLPSHFFSELSNFQGKRKLTLQDNLHIPKNQSNFCINPSPKFGDSVANTSKSIAIPDSPRKKQFTLRRAQQSIQKKKYSPKKSVMGVETGFKKKQNPVNEHQSEYKAMECQIRFYQQQIEKMIYQSQKMEEQTENLMENFNSESYEKQLEMHAKDIKGINKQIEEQRQLEMQLNKMVLSLEEEYEGVVHSIKTANFPRPALIKDEAKALIDEINSLRAEFQALERDDGSLNLSSTLLQLPSHTGFTPQATTLRNKKNQCQTAKLRIKEIYEQNKINSDPRFLTNLKHACLKEEWSLFANSELQVNVSFREAPRISIRLGNKLTKDLGKFTLRQNDISKLQGQIIAARSYLQHFLDITPSIVNDLFLKIDLSYEILGEKRDVVFFVPVGLTNFGQFSPITQREFENDAGSKPFEYSGGFRPIDKKIIANVCQITVYMPNLMVDVGRQKCVGLFISPFDDYELVVMRQKGESLSISTKTQNWPLIRLLEFIFTV